MPNHITNHLYINGDNKKVLECLTLLYNNGKRKDTQGFTEVIDFNSIVPMPECLNTVCSCGSLPKLASKLCFIYSEYYQLYYKELYSEKYKKKHTNELNFDINLNNINTFISNIKFKKQSSLLQFFDDINVPRKHSVDLTKEISSLTTEHTTLLLQYVKNIETTGYTDWYYWSVNHWGTKWNAYNSSYDDYNFKVSDKDAIDCLPNFLMFDTAWSSPIAFVEALSKKYSDLEFTLKYMDEDIHGDNFDELIFDDGEYFSTDPNKEEICLEIMGEDVADIFGVEDGDENEGDVENIGIE